MERAVPLVAGFACSTGAVQLLSGCYYVGCANGLAALMLFGMMTESLCTHASLPFYAPWTIGLIIGILAGSFCAYHRRVGHAVQGVAAGLAIALVALSTPLSLSLDPRGFTAALYTVAILLSIALGIANVLYPHRVQIFTSALVGSFLVMAPLDYLASTGYGRAVLGVWSALLGDAPVFAGFSGLPRDAIGWPDSKDETPPYTWPSLYLCLSAVVLLAGVAFQWRVLGKPARNRAVFLPFSDGGDDFSDDGGDARALLDYDSDSDDDDAAELVFADEIGATELGEWGAERTGAAADRRGRVFGR